MAFLLEAIAREALGDGGAADQALERALDWAEPDGALVFFLWHPVPGLLERHARGCARHAALVSETLTLLTPRSQAPPDPVPAAMRGPRRYGGAETRPRGPRGVWGRSFPRADGAVEPQRDAGAALPADEPVRPGDRPGTVSVGDHRPDAHKPPVRQARRPPPHRGRRAGPRSGPARAIPHAPRWSAPRNRIMPRAHAAWRECRDDLAGFGLSTRLGEPPRTLAAWVGVPGFCPPRWSNCPGYRFSEHLDPGKSSQLYDADPSSRARRLEVSQ